MLTVKDLKKHLEQFPEDMPLGIQTYGRQLACLAEASDLPCESVVGPCGWEQALPAGTKYLPITWET